MSCLRSQGVARRIRVASALLEIKKAQVLNTAFDKERPEDLLLPVNRCKAVASEAGIEHLVFKAGLAAAELSPEFCAREDSLAFVLEKAVKTQEAHIDVLQKMADSYLSLFDSDGYKLDAASASWEMLARNVFTLILTALIMRCNDDSDLQRAVLQSLSLPTQVKLRSWPSKKQLETLREYWASRTDEERVVLTTIQGPRMWMIHNCDYVLGAREVRDYNTIFLPRTRILKTAEEEEACKRRLDACRRAVGLEHFAGLDDGWGLERMFFTKEFFRQPRALDRILKHAVQQSSARNELLKFVDSLTCPFKLNSASYRLIAEDRPTPLPTWGGVATVVYTLVLDAILVRCESCRALETALKLRMLKVEDETSQKTTAHREEKARRKRQARSAKEAQEREKGVTPMSQEEIPDGEEAAVTRLDVGAAGSNESSTEEVEHPGYDSLAPQRPRREFYHGQWCGAVLPTHHWFVRNTFVDVDDSDSDSASVRGSQSCPVSPR
jgi:hypothetical protein